ncbi:hypothetical protein BSKO_13178 [Bryopsis sp. KO-2023]|nr:hypothetical protein BSKO_13178 [Bryopsis sp. KO-2023]
MSLKTDQTDDDDDKIVVVVDDISERTLWPAISEPLKARMPLYGLIFENKFGKSVHVQELDVEFLLSKHQKIQRLKPYKHSPISWFKFPYAHIIVVTSWESADYKSNVRPKLRAMLDANRSDQALDSLSEWVIVYVRPPEVDQAARGPRKVFEKLQNDFNPKRLERCVRLDFAFGPSRESAVTILGMDDLARTLKDCVKASFQTRQAAYEEEVRKLMIRRLEPGWNFSTLYLVKDSLALMLTVMGLLEDALREYFELEACYLEALAEGGALAGSKFGGDETGDDVSTLMTATWNKTRQAVMSRKGLTEFKFRQYLFAAQARLLIKLGRPVEVIERGLKFIQTFSRLLKEKEKANESKPLFREVWSFSACLSIATVVVKVYRAQERHDPQGDVLGTALRQEHGAGKGDRVELSEVNWEVGVPGLENMTVDLDPNALGGRRKHQGPGGQRYRDTRSGGSRDAHFYCLLGHVYAIAREELRLVGEAFEVDTPEGSAPLGLPQADLLPTFAPVCLMSHSGSADSGKSFMAKKASSMIESLQHKIEASMISRTTRGGMSSMSHSGDMTSLDIERAPSWMSRAGLTKTPRYHRRSNTSGGTLDRSPGSVTSFISLGSEIQPQERSPLHPGTPAPPDSALEMSSVKSMGSRTSMESLSSYHVSTDPPAPSDNNEDEPGPGITLSRATDLSESFIMPSRSESATTGGGSWATQLSSDPLMIMPSDSSQEHQEVGGAPTTSGPSISPFSMDRENWMSDWRLRRALSSDDLFEDLFVEVTLAAAWCYSRTGRVRTSAVLRSDVAPLLLRHGLVSASQQLYQMKSDMYFREGWDTLKAQVLPQMAACLRGTEPTMLMATCLNYLGLPEGCGVEAIRNSMQEELVSCAEELDREGLSEQHLVTAPALQINLAKARMSFYYGEESDGDGGPILFPPAVPATELASNCKHRQPGAILMNAGDVVDVEIEINSRLPEGLDLTNAVLVLSTAGGRGVLSEAASQSQTVSPEPGRLPPFFSLISASSSKMESRRKMHRATSSILEGTLEQVTRSLHCPCSDSTEPGKKTVRIEPGNSLLRFKCRPMQEGIYTVQHILADLQSAPICIPVVQEDSKNPVQPSWTNLSGMRRRPSTAEALSGPGPSPVQGEMIIVQVRPSAQRITVSSIAPQDSLVCHKYQWVGILIHSEFEQLSEATLTLRPIDRGPQPSSQAFVMKIRMDGLDCHGEWVDVEEGGVVGLPDVALGETGLLVWSLMEFGVGCESSEGGTSKEGVDENGGSLDRHWALETRVDYLSGCQRSHVMLLRFPVVDPFTLETSMINLESTGDSLLTVNMTSCLPLACVLDGVVLSGTSSSDENGFTPNALGIKFPCPLQRSESLSLMYRISAQEAKLLSSSLDGAPTLRGMVSIKYKIKTYAEYPRPVRCSDFLAPNNSLDFPVALPPPPSQPPPKLNPDNCSGDEEFEFSSPFTFDAVVGVDGSDRDSFRVTLLPPSQASVGVPVALAWALERLAGKHSNDDVPYTIAVEGMWQPCVPLEGVVKVPIAPGSSATLEGLFVPMSDGDLVPPKLVLSGTKTHVQATFVKVGAG